MKKYLFVILSLVFILMSCSNKNIDNDQSINEGLANSLINVTNKDNGYANPNSIISSEELNKIINKNKVKVVGIIDDKLFDKYIPFSSLISMRDITTTINGVEGMLVDKEKMEKVLSNLGIYNGDTVIIYDNNNGLYAARLWWSMKVYGHKNIKILNGGLNSWINSGYETTNNPIVPPKSYYIAKDKNKNIIADLEDIKKSFENKDEIVLDVRSEEEYKAGHIPGAVWIEWKESLNEDGKFKSPKELKSIYENKGITNNKDAIITQCLKGIRASHTYFVLSELLGYDNIKVYDGSWTEYSQSGEPIEK